MIVMSGRFCEEMALQGSESGPAFGRMARNAKAGTCRLRTLLGKLRT